MVLGEAGFAVGGAFVGDATFAGGCIFASEIVFFADLNFGDPILGDEGF